MAALYQRKGSDIWNVDFVYRGLRYRKSTKTNDRVLAELYLKDLEVKIARDNLGFAELNNKEVRLTEFIEEYLKHSKAQKARSTYLIDQRVLNYFKDFLGNIQLMKVSYKQGEDFKVFLLEKMKPISVNAYLKHLKAAFERAVEWELIRENPLRKIKPCKVKNSNIPKFFDKTEIKIFLNSIPEGEFKQYILFCLYTGCRRNEAINLMWDDIDMERGYVTFRVTKSGKSRVVPFDGVITGVLNSIPRKGEKPFTLQSDFVTHKFKKYVRASGLKNQSLKLHSLRHTFASHLIMGGVDMMTVSKLLGHSSIRVTEVYAHLVPDHMKAAIGRLNFQ